MVEPFYTVFRVLHVGGGWLAFAAAPLALLAIKGGRRHVLAGRCFTLCLGLGATAGILLSAIRPDPAPGLFFIGLATLFATGTRYLAPQVGRGSRRHYLWDRVLTVVGVLASLGLVVDGLTSAPLSVSFQEGAVYGREEEGLELEVEPVALEMRSSCEKCQESLGASDVAFICSYECTFCAPCADRMARRCPNCGGGELVPRPRRAAQ